MAISISAETLQTLNDHRDRLTEPRAYSEWNADNQLLRDAVLDIIAALQPTGRNTQTQTQTQTQTPKKTAG